MTLNTADVYCDCVIDTVILVSALLKSVSVCNFISGALCHKLNLRKRTCDSSFKVHLLTGQPLSRGTIRFCVGPISLQVGLLHMENIVLLVLESSTIDVILRHTWLIHHSSVISWSTGDILKWREQRFPDCFLFLNFPRTLNQLYQWTCALHLSKVPSNSGEHLWRFLRPIPIFRTYFCP